MKNQIYSGNTCLNTQLASLQRELLTLFDNILVC